ncbi:MAG: protein phosphatase 2C domain-containing protein [Gammaproteobacteria bacterium]
MNETEQQHLHWTTAAETHPGVRRRVNEDAILVRPEVGLWAVADGMGGHEAGDVASRMVTEALGSLERNQSLSRFVDDVDDTLIAINRRLRAHASEQFDGRPMGCTIVALIAGGRVGVCLWAGDSRLYRLRHGELRQITRDHSPLEEAVERGLMTAEEAAERPESSVITHAVGGMEELHLDIVVFEVEPDDTYLLCSDGLYRELDNKEILARLADESVERSVDGLLDCALERGARDNVSIIVSRANAA